MGGNALRLFANSFFVKLQFFSLEFNLQLMVLTLMRLQHQF